MSSAHTCASADDEVAGVRIPRTPMAIEAAEAARASLPRAITGHASRVFVLASLAAQRAGETCDADALYVAAMYANMGLSTAYGRSAARYELDSADAADTFLLRHQTSQRLRDDVWHAIALHTTPGVAARVSPLVGRIRVEIGGHQVGRDGGRQHARGVAHRPASTFGTWSADVLERADPDFHRLNFCGRVLGARWQDA